jgi:predicted ester cyclase
MGGTGMSSEANNYVVRNYYAALEKNGVQATRPFLAVDFTACVAGLPWRLNRTEYEQFGAIFSRAFEGLQHEIYDLVGEGDKIVARIQLTGTQVRSFQGVPPTYRTISISMAAFFTLEKRKITHLQVIYDQLGLLQQLGVLPISEDVIVGAAKSVPVYLQM